MRLPPPGCPPISGFNVLPYVNREGSDLECSTNTSDVLEAAIACVLDLDCVAFSVTGAQPGNNTTVASYCLKSADVATAPYYPGRGL